jgi:hypothetical protein
MNARELELDYFQIYDVANQWVKEAAVLKDQFDREPERGRVLFLDWFANPVSKNDEPFHDKTAHLTGYYLYQSIPDPKRRVIFENQFGRHKIFIGRAIRLLTPAAKRTKEEVLFCKELSHYRVYQVLEGEPLEERVKLQDQFGASEGVVTYPYGFAVPVEKEHEGKRYPIYNEKAHLMLYRLRAGSTKRGVAVADQFGRYYVGIYRPVLLAVPSLKIEWSVVEE